MAGEEINVENFIRFLISLGGIYDIDDEGYIISKMDQSDVLIEHNGKKRKIMVFKEVMKDNDALILNPLNETIGESEDKKWLYLTISLGLSYRLKKLLLTVVDSCINNKDLDVSVLEVINQFKTSEIDDKTEEEIRLLTKDLSIFSNVYYRKKFKESRWRCAAFEEDSRSLIKRKKTLKFIDSVFQAIFELDNMSPDQLNKHYSFATSLITCPKLNSILNVYNLIYTKLNKYLEILVPGDDDFVVDLGELGYHLENLDKYYKRVKWFVSDNTAPVKEEKKEVFNPGMSLQPNGLIDFRKEKYYETPEGVPIIPKKSTFNIMGNSSFLSQDTKYIDPFQSNMNMNQMIPLNGGYNSGYNQGFIPL